MNERMVWCLGSITAAWWHNNQDCECELYIVASEQVNGIRSPSSVISLPPHAEIRAASDKLGAALQ